jgi:glycosyl transferase family 25
MKAFVINLERDAARMARISVLLDGLSEVDWRLDWERFDAFGPDRIVQASQTLDLPLLHGPCSTGELGCALSHYHLWLKIVEDGLPYALVMEDDLHFSTTAVQALRQLDALAAGGFAFDIVKAETFYAGIVVDRQMVPLGADKGMYRLRSNHGGAGAYIVSRRGAERLIERYRHSARAVDLMMFAEDLDELIVWQMHPAPCVQDHLVGTGRIGIVSSIGPERAERLQSNALKEAIRARFVGAYHALISLWLWHRGRRKFRSLWAGMSEV